MTPSTPHPHAGVDFPLATFAISLGFDPIWFGVMSMLMVTMGLVFPPWA
jgi:TRAP-type C4-dicarboxylate transport system permease large subunit